LLGRLTLFPRLFVRPLVIPFLVAEFVV
jgi:hypothetical protein